MQPVLLGTGLPVTCGEEQGSGLDTPCQAMTGLARETVGRRVFQRPGVLFTQANGLAQPEPLQARAGMRRAICHAAFR